MTPRRYTWRLFPGDPTSVRSARVFLRETCLQWGMPVPSTDTAVQIGNELAANAVEHGTGDVSVSLIDDGLTCLVTVTDHGTVATALTVSLPGDDAEDGRGLFLVEALADAWGWYLTRGGTAVWAQLARPVPPEVHR